MATDIFSSAIIVSDRFLGQVKRHTRLDDVIYHTYRSSADQVQKIRICKK